MLRIASDADGAAILDRDEHQAGIGAIVGTDGFDDGHSFEKSTRAFGVTPSIFAAPLSPLAIQITIKSIES
jgi:hypothetical protein